MIVVVIVVVIVYVSFFHFLIIFELGAYGGVGIQWFIPVILVYHARK